MPILPEILMAFPFFPKNPLYPQPPYSEIASYFLTVTDAISDHVLILKDL
jgi:hypothetical protein